MLKRTCKLKWWSWKLNLVEQARKILHAHTLVGKNRFRKGKQRVFIKYSQKIRIQITNRQEGHMQNGGFEPSKTSSKWNKQVEEKRDTKSSYDWFRLAHYSDKKKLNTKIASLRFFISHYYIVREIYRVPKWLLCVKWRNGRVLLGKRPGFFFNTKSLILFSK